MTLSEEIVRELTGLEATATIAPWANCHGMIVSPPGDAELGNWCVVKAVQWDEDRQLIIAMRNHLPAILSALARSRRMVEALEAVEPFVVASKQMFPRIADRQRIDEALKLLRAALEDSPNAS